MKHYDIHTHLFNLDIYPLEVFFNRIEVPKTIATFAIKYYTKHHNLFKTIEYIVENFGINFTLPEIAEIFNKTIEENCDFFITKMDKVGIDKTNILLIDLYEPFDYHVHKPLYYFQLYNIVEKKYNNRFNLFFGFDPRRNWFDLGKPNWFLKEFNFKGFKLYPSLGFHPDPNENPEFIKNNLKYFYKYCETNNIPIIAHASKGGITGELFKSNYSNPKNWINVLNEYPNLKLCLAHDGGGLNKQWSEQLNKMLVEYSNLYTDVAFHEKSISTPKNYFEHLIGLLHSDIKDKIMFGSDYPLHEFFYTYEELVIAYKQNLGKFLWEKISYNNIIKFMGEL